MRIFDEVNLGKQSGPQVLNEPNSFQVRGGGGGAVIMPDTYDIKSLAIRRMVEILGRFENQSGISYRKTAPTSHLPVGNAIAKMAAT
jgi:hypothetical protein